jgi:hypothetical protein
MAEIWKGQTDRGVLHKLSKTMPRPEGIYNKEGRRVYGRTHNQERGQVPEKEINERGQNKSQGRKAIPEADGGVAQRAPKNTSARQGTKEITKHSHHPKPRPPKSSNRRVNTLGGGSNKETEPNQRSAVRGCKKGPKEQSCSNLESKKPSPKGRKGKSQMRKREGEGNRSQDVRKPKEIRC